MPIVPPVPSPNLALAVPSRPQQSGRRLIGHRTRAKEVGVRSAALRDDSSKRGALQRSRPIPLIGFPRRPNGMIATDGERSRDPPSRRDRNATHAIVSVARLRRTTPALV